MNLLRPVSYLTIVLALLYTSCTDHSATSDANQMPKGTTGEGTEVGQHTPSGIFDDYVNTNREIWQKPDMVIDFLGDLKGKTVADLGAGIGYFTRRLVPRAGRVIAIDIEPQFVNYLDSLKANSIPEEYRNRLETRLAKPDNPYLDAEEADAVLIVNTYAFLPNRIEYLKKVKRGMTPGGKLLIIDFKKKSTPIGHPSEIRIPLYQVEQELKEAGFTIGMTNDIALDYQYVVLAIKNAES